MTLDHSTGFYTCRICSACENTIKMNYFNSTSSENIENAQHVTEAFALFLFSKSLNMLSSIL